MGIFCTRHSEVNLIGGEISNNIAENLSSLTLVTPKSESDTTNLSSTYNSIYGTGVYVHASKIKINEGFKIQSNNSKNNSKIILQERTKINSSAAAYISGAQMYCSSSEVTINNADITKGTIENNNEILLLFNSFKYRCKDLKFIHKLQNYLEQYINCEKPLDYILEIKYLINSNYKFSIDINNLLKQIFNYDYDLFCYVMNSNVNYTLDINKNENLKKHTKNIF